MAGPVLLVHDDIATIAAIRRLLAREGYEIVLATSAADAVIGFGHHLPALILLAPSVEGGRGHLALEEIQQHPDAGLARVLLLGESIPGVSAPVVPLPLEGALFLEMVANAVRGGSAPAPLVPVPDSVHEATTAPYPQQDIELAEDEPAAPPPAAAPSAELEAALEETYGAAEPELPASYDAPAEEPAAAAPDSELDLLEEEVRAEAARRREAREAARRAAEAAPPAPPPAPAEPSSPAAHEAEWFGEESDSWAPVRRRNEAEAAARTDADRAERLARPLGEEPWLGEDAPKDAWAGGGNGLSTESAFADLSEEIAGEPAPEAAAPAEEPAAPEEPAAAPEALAAVREAEAARLAAAEQARQEVDRQGHPPGKLLILDRELITTAKYGVQAPDETHDEAALERELLASAKHRAAPKSTSSEESTEQVGRFTLGAPPPAKADDSEDAERVQAQRRARALERERLAAELEAAKAQDDEPPEEEQKQRSAALEADLFSDEAQAPAPAANADAEEDGAQAQDASAAEAPLDFARGERGEGAEEKNAEAAPPDFARGERGAEEEIAEASPRDFARGERGEEQARAEAERAAAAEIAEAELEAEAEEQAEAERLAAGERARAAAEARAEAERAAAEEIAEAEISELTGNDAALAAAGEEPPSPGDALDDVFLPEALEGNGERGSAARAALEELDRSRASARARAQTLSADVVLREQEVMEAEQAARGSAQREQAAKHAASRAEELARMARRQAEAAAKTLEREQAAEREATAREAQSAAQEVQLERGRRARLEDELERLRAAAEQAREAAEAAAQAALEERATREAAERSLAEARREAAAAREDAERRVASTVIPFDVPGRAPLHVPSSGSVDLRGLARVVLALSRSGAEARLELRSSDALRTLWFHRGAIVGATSSLVHESLLERARRDGLIDAEQERELRLLRAAASGELVRVLRARGYVRDTEAVPLVQRFTEQVALEALSEPQCLYRIAREPMPDSEAVATAPRSALQLLTEALRRALSAEAALELLGGVDAIPLVADPAELRALGLSERERRLLEAADGESTVEELLLESGLRQEVGAKVLAAAWLLQLLEVKAGAAPRPLPTPELDVRRLDAKYREIQESDYFSILGLSRSAGTDEVQRAFHSLSSEFNPLRFVGHSDPSLALRAREVSDVLAEAAQALQDDRLRENYARSLTD